MNDQPNDTNKNEANSADYKRLIFSATANLSLLFLKAILILNSGALVSILIAVSRSDDRAMSSVLIDTSTYFGVGLTAGIVGIMLYHAAVDLGDEALKRLGISNFRIAFSGMSLLLSVSIFLYGVWDVIGGLKELFASS